MHKDVQEPPRREVGASALILNDAGDVLLVEARGEDEMILPGGSAMQNEPPHMAMTRKVRDLTGLEVTPARLLVIDVYPGNLHGDEWESVNFVFYCGTVNFNDPHMTDAKIDHLWAERSKLTGHTLRDQYRRIRQSLLILEQGNPIQYMLHGHRVDVRVDGAERPIS
ncbi:NUDIX domain-containing protein [Streptomyces silvensis]|uniref:Uncharacterized protein n=1 Tax=Streptomyces silvensis TaxID=1765722 RepID=A0A0W7XB36_9ACTN|nr:NUDIX hydrolase [Streptomyces silvensis]KUF19984.1 hypothetical protein AT728_27670 [Streptomyces silvensis]